VAKALKASKKVRLLLLSRAADEWWRQLKLDHSIGTLISENSEVRTSALLGLDAAERPNLFSLAVKCFSERLGRGAPTATKQKFESRLFSNPLNLHMAAVLATLHEPNSKPMSAAEQGFETRMLDALIRHEELKHRELLPWFALPLNVQRRLLPLAVWLLGGTGVESIEVFCRRLAKSGPLGKAVPLGLAYELGEFYRTCYPPAGLEWASALLPDRVRERVRELHPSPW